ncbi:MAG: pyrimidine utilization flavin reductase protein F [Burkholderiaceae bacterium]
MIDKQTYRDAMARLAAAVSIVTSDGPGGLCGSTVSAVSSVSDTPPILLVCINRGSRNNAVLKANRWLCVNVLSDLQQLLANQFALSGSSAKQRFAGGNWLRHDLPESTLSAAASVWSAPSSLPALADALVSLDCQIIETAELGSHTVFYCAVERAHFGKPGRPLVYFERGFRMLAGPAINKPVE